MNDLAEWLLEQIAEDERIAQACVMPAHDGYKPHAALAAWLYEDGDEVVYDFTDPTGYSERFYVTCDSEGLRPAVDEEPGRHIATWDPARALAECAVKRQMIERWRPPNLIEYDWPWALRLLALPYVDREGYDEAWRP